MNADWIIEVCKHGLLVKAPTFRGGVPLDALEKATKIAKVLGYRTPDWHMGIAKKFGAVFALGSKASLKRWAEEIEHAAATQPVPIDRWLAGVDRGISSETIVWALWPEARPQLSKDRGVPHDPSDFGRCFRLLEGAPEMRADLPKVAELFPEWGPFVAHWEELEALWREESPSGTCPKLYDRMQDLEHLAAVTTAVGNTGSSST